MAAPVITPTPSNEKRYQCRIEELPTLSEFLIESLERDLLDFIAHSPVYSADYIAEFRKKRELVTKLIAPRAITDQKKVVTEDLYDMLSAMRQPLNKLENYVTLASTRKTLTVLPGDFGISRVREAIANSDVEEVDGAMKILKKHITDNYTALKDMGYSDTQRDELYATADKVNDDNAGQNIKDDERDNLAEKNMSKYNELWDIMTEVCSTGKSLYLVPQPAKADEYTMSSLINRVRNEDPKPRFRTLVIKKNTTRVLENVVNNSTAENTGEVDLEWWIGDGEAPVEGTNLWKKNTEAVITAPDGIISVRNSSQTENGKIHIQAIGENSN